MWKISIEMSFKFEIEFKAPTAPKYMKFYTQCLVLQRITQMAIYVFYILNTDDDRDDGDAGADGADDGDGGDNGGCGDEL